MMRTPSNWAVAVRKPDGEIAQVCRVITLADGEAADLPAPGDPRRDRARRVARDRLSRARDLGELRRADRGRRGGLRALARADHLRVRAGDRLRAHALQGRPGARHEPPGDRHDPVVRRGRGADPRRRLHPLPPRHLAAPGPPAALPVPRGRAQGDQRVRGRRGADARARRPLQPHPPALRHGVPAVGDGDRDLRLRVLRPAGVVLAHREPHRHAAR